MRTKWIAFVLVGMLSVTGCGKRETANEASKKAKAAEERSNDVRPPAVNGKWYPATADEINAMIDKLLKEAKHVPVHGKVIGMIVPDSPWEKAGKCSAAAYRLLHKGDYGRVIVLGSSHYTSFEGASVPSVKAYRTPLGTVPLDREALDGLLENAGLFQSMPSAHKDEYSVETQLPFLQRCLGKFTLIPILLGECRTSDIQRIVSLLRPLITEKTLIVVSSDLTHYGERYDFTPFKSNVAQSVHKLDQKLISAIQSMQMRNFLLFEKSSGAKISGVYAIALFLDLMPTEARAHLLDYYCTGDLTKDWTNSESFASIAFVLSGKSEKEAIVAGGQLSEAEQRTLLKIARQTLLACTKGRVQITLDPKEITPRLKDYRGCFVTLRKNGKLRGEMGRVEPRAPLYQEVVQETQAAAMRDFRFDPVSADEVPQIQIEISVVGPLRPIEDPKEIVPGRQGVVLERIVGIARAQAIVLPQEIKRRKWSREKILEELSRRAGLPPDGWKKATLRVFTVQTFAEKPPAPKVGAKQGSPESKRTKPAGKKESASPPAPKSKAVPPTNP